MHRGTRRPGATPLAGAQPLAEILTAPSLAGAEVLAGAAGLDRAVERLNIMEVPDILPWVKPHEFLLTTAYPLRGRPESLPELVADLDDAGLAGIGVKLGRYIDELPQAMLAVANERTFPVVRLPYGVAFDEILNDVLTGILNRQAQALARSERIHRAFLQLVLRGHGLPEIARDLADLLDGPALIVAGDRTLLASARIDELGIDREVARVDALDADAGWVTIGRRRFPAACVPITAGARAHGHVVALADGHPPKADALALENAATVAALALTKQLEVQAVEGKYRSDLMHELLRQVDDPDDAVRRARGFGWDLERPLLVAVLRVEPAGVEDAPGSVPPTSALEQVVLARDPAAALVHSTREVVILTGAIEGPEAPTKARRLAERLVREAHRAVGVPWSAGLSRPVPDVHRIREGYEQAVRALVIGRDMHGPGGVAHFDDLGVHRVLALVEDRAELEAFSDEVLGELTADTDAAADLRHTLEVLIEAGGNVAEAARRLHFHYNTLRYRIDKLEAMVGPFMTDARVRLDVQLALLVRAMRGLRDR